MKLKYPTSPGAAPVFAEKTHSMRLPLFNYYFVRVISIQQMHE